MDAVEKLILAIGATRAASEHLTVGRLSDVLETLDEALNEAVAQAVTDAASDAK